MNTTKAVACLVIVLCTMSGCSDRGTDHERNPIARAGEQAAFVNRVWKVAESPSVAPGQLYVFLSEGTLVVASPNGTPSLGTWSRDSAGLKMVEEGVSYSVDILGLSDTEFRIRSHNPGQPVEIRFVPADSVVSADSVMSMANESDSASGRLWGTTWRLEDLGGTGVLDRVEATLGFTEAGRVAGGGSCNRFFGTVEISGDSIRFGPLGSTRMACAEAVGIQESKYLKALQDAQRFTLDGSTLLIHSKGLERPLRFVRQE